MATAAGQIDLAYISIATLLPLVETGKVKPLAVTTKKRSSMLPTIPALDETLPGYDRLSWFGLLAPAGVPPGIIMQLNAAISKSMATPEVTASLNKLGLEPQASTPGQFAIFIHREIIENNTLLNLTGIKTE